MVGGPTLAPLAGPSWQSAQVGVGGLSCLDADPAVDGLGAVGAGDDGAQLELGDLRQVIGHPGDPQQHVPQRGEVGGGSAAAPEQPRGGGCRPDQVIGVGVGERGEPGGPVSQRIAVGAAEPEQHQRAGHLLVQHADPHLDAAGDHRLDNDAGQPAAEGLRQRAEPAPDLIRALEAGQHVAGGAGAQQAGHVRAERDGAAEPGRRRDRGVLGDDPDAVR